jgi:hypothetical protein
LELIEYDENGATVHLSKKDIFMLLCLVQEGRIALEDDTPGGEALFHRLKSLAGKVDGAHRADNLH